MSVNAVVRDELTKFQELLPEVIWRKHLTSVDGSDTVIEFSAISW
jgi:hypothetical protein